jgi:hypothetical protein
VWDWGILHCGACCVILGRDGEVDEEPLSAAKGCCRDTFLQEETHKVLSTKQFGIIAVRFLQTAHTF